MKTQLLSALIGALAGAVVTVIGWLVNYYFSRKQEDETRRREAALRHLERQMEELYGPLWGLIQQSQTVYEVACKRLPSGPDGRTDPSRFNQQDGATWHYLVESYFLPTNAHMAELIRTKVYLIDADEIPASFQEFLVHQMQLEVLHRLWKERGVDSTHVANQGWPPQFSKDVAASLEGLKKRYQDYLQRARLEFRENNKNG